MYPDNIPNPTVADVLHRLDLGELYGKINDWVHEIECQFGDMEFYCEGYGFVFIDNPFPKKYTNNNVSPIFGNCLLKSGKKLCPLSNNGGSLIE